jgi:hypothetical protein
MPLVKHLCSDDAVEMIKAGAIEQLGLLNADCKGPACPPVKVVVCSGVEPPYVGEPGVLPPSLLCCVSC